LQGDNGGDNQDLFESVFCRFDSSIEITLDSGVPFIANLIKDLMKIFNVMHYKSNPYYPRMNGQVDSTHNVLVRALTKICDLKRHDWAGILHVVLWALSDNMEVCHTPFKLAFRKKAIF
jgi:hypothetical protein